MKAINRLSLISLLAVFCFSFCVPSMAAAYTVQAAEKKEYVCPPCGCGKDDAALEKPGACDACGMALVEKGSPASRPMQAEPQPERKKAAILIFEGVQIIDYTGPYEVFGQAGLNVYTVAVGADPITTSMGMRVTPSYTLETSPAPDVLIIPGGNVTNAQNDPKVIKWIQENAKQAQYVLSVCNGAFILARTGLLDGLSATTFYGLIDGFVAFAPKTTVVTDRRYVDNGRVITTAGLSSGIDGSLYVISKLMSKAAAQMVALNMEYNWQPDSKYARANFADRHLRKIFLTNLRFNVPAGARLSVLSTEGDSEKWEVSWQVQGEISASEVSKLINEKLAGDGKWSRQGTQSASDTTSQWKFNDEKGATWNATSSVQAVSGEKNKLVATIKLYRGEPVKAAVATPSQPRSN
jgi:putative intracellular protease/amidase